MSIKELLKVVTPPDKPVYAPSKEDWEKAEYRLGVHFPEDYFSTIHAYGSGAFLGGEFRLVNPVDPRDSAFAEDELGRLKETKNHAPSQLPFDIHPAKPGLFPFAIDGNGNTFLWLTGGKPESWPIVCLNSEDYYEVSNHSLSEFITLLSQGRVDINVKKFWGEQDKLAQCKFVPKKGVDRI